jgi:hypothetical protein
MKIGDNIHYRFLDRLFIPTTTDELSSDQIELINRFRESNITIDGQFAYREQVRNLFDRCFTKLKYRNALEIGPGKFPLVCPTFQRYASVDIDHEALAGC